MMNNKRSCLTGIFLQSIVFTLFLSLSIFTTCSLEGDISAQRPKPVEIPPQVIPDPIYPDNKTFIVFDNTQGICAVSVYEDYRRRDEDKIAEIPAGGSSGKITWTSGDSVPFYFSYRVTIKGINDFSLNYVPEPGRDQKAVRIDADTTTTIKIPTLSETLSSPDTLLSNNSYLIIQNNSSYSFELHRGTSKVKPDNISSPLVNNGERAQYTINPGPASNYRLLVGTDYKEFSASIVNFEAGHIYNFDFNGSILLVGDTELKLKNINGVTIPQPPAAPVVITSNGFIALQWTAVESATAYEIWMSTVNGSASASKYGTDVVASLSATISGLNNGTTYYFWLKAKNNLGTSDFSLVASGIPSASTVKPPDPQTAPSIIAGNGQLTVSWQAVEDASVYEVWVGTTNNAQTATKRGEDVSGFSTVISGLNNGTAYYVWIKAKNDIGVSGFSPVVNSKPLGTPGVPTLSSGSEQLSVTWTAVAGADQYEVYYGIGTPTTLAVTTTGTTATITGLTAGTIYYVRLRAKNATGASDYGPSLSGVPMGSTGVVTVYSGNGQLSLSWSAIAGADQYEVYYSTTNSIPSNPTQTISTTTTTISGLTNGTTYYVWVKGKNAYGTSNTSVVASGKPLGTPGTPTLSPDYKQLQVKWAAVAGADEYEVYYGIGTPTTLAVTTAGTTVTITGLTAGTTYYVRLRAKNTNGVSEYGSIVSGVPDNYRTPGLYRGFEKIGNQNLTAALSWISTNVVSGDEFYIVLGANESISSTVLLYYDDNYNYKTVGITLLGYGSERTITLNANGTMFSVVSGVTLTLDQNITLVGRSTNTNSLIYVSHGNLIMNDGAKIRGNTSSGSGGGVSVGSGTFTINGGTISENTVLNDGGGISVYSGTLIMNDGIISGNKATNWEGGGINLKGGTFTMRGGTIRENTSMTGGGICISDSGIFTMNGGTISGNSNEGVAIWGGNKGVFKKLPPSGGQNSGIIYGSESELSLRNSCAVSATRSRNTTAEQTDQIDTTTGKGLSANGYPPYGQ